MDWEKDYEGWGRLYERNYTFDRCAAGGSCVVKPAALGGGVVMVVWRWFHLGRKMNRTNTTLTWFGGS